MIILIIIVVAILTFISAMYIADKTKRIAATSLFVVLLAASVLTIMLSFTHHLGMKKVTTTTTQQIYTAGDTKQAFGMLIYQSIGTKSENQVLVFRDKADEEKPKAHFVPDTKHITEAVKKKAYYQLSDDNTAQVVTKTSKYVFENSFYKLLFGISGQQNELIEQVQTVKVPKNSWVAVTAEQAKKLASEMASKQANMTEEEKMAQMQALAGKSQEEIAQIEVEQINQLLAQ